MPNMIKYWSPAWAKRFGLGLILSIAAPSLAHADPAIKAFDTRGLAPDFRLAIIGFRVASSNADACPSPQMLTGMMLQDEAGFPKSTRDEAKRWHGLGSGFGITRIVPGSPAAMAGLNHGDEIVAMNGTDLTGFARDLVKRKASYARTERFVEELDVKLKQGPVALRVKQNGNEREVTLTGTPGCGGYTVLVDSNELNAWSDGRYVAVTTRMVRFAASDDELAFVVAHEMAHNNLRHSDRFGTGKLLLAQFGFGSGQVRDAELAADELAIEMMASAGYDLGSSETLLLRSGKHRGLNLSLSHPGTRQRVTGTRQARSHLVIRQTVRSAPSPQPQREAQAVVAVALVVLPPAQIPAVGTPQLVASPTRSASLSRNHTDGITELAVLTEARADPAPTEGLPR